MKIRDDAWIISDTHFGHGNIIKYAGRPFPSAAVMDRSLVQKWNAAVKQKDQVIFLGDFSFGNAEETVDYRKSLNGQIIMVMGNHDRGRSADWWKNVCGMEEVFDCPIIFKDFFILSHEPVEWVSERLPVLNIHGHTHEKTVYNMTNHHFNVSVEVIGYRPMPLAAIIEEGRRLSSL